MIIICLSVPPLALCSYEWLCYSLRTLMLSGPLKLSREREGKRKGVYTLGHTGQLVTQVMSGLSRTGRTLHLRLE